MIASLPVEQQKALFRSSLKERALLLQGHPTELTIELTTRCQLHCRTCPREAAKDSYLRLGDMDFELFSRLAKEHLPYLDYLSLAGGLGEPLLYPKIKEAVQLARSLNPQTLISISTNALAPGTPELIQQLSGALSFIQISLDGTGELFEEIVGLEKTYDRFSENARAILLSAGAANTAVRFNCVVQPKNYRRLSEIVRQVAEWGGTRLYFNTYNLVCAPAAEECYALFSSPEYHSTLEGLIELGKTNGVAVGYFDMREVNGFSYCPFPWNNFYITWEGQVAPCCAKPFPELMSFGNLREISLTQAINSSAAVAFRKMSKQNRTPEFCRRCHLQALNNNHSDNRLR